MHLTEVFFSEVIYFCLENNILLIKIEEEQMGPFPYKLQIF